MARYPQPAQGDAPMNVSLDGAFMGIDARREADFGDAVAGRVTEAINTRFINGDIYTRPGCVAPLHFNPTFQAIQGAAIYSDPAGAEWMAVADRETTFLLADCRSPRTIALPAATQITGRVSMLQAFDKLLMFRGLEQDSLIWNGGNTTWQKAPLHNDFERPSFLKPLPRAEWGVLMADRVFVPISRDEIAWSDILEPNRFDLTLNKVRFNQGEDDSLVAAAPYQGNRLVVFKDQSIWFLNAVIGDMSAASPDRLPGKIGCVARGSIVDVGSDIFFLGQEGVYSLGQTEQGQLRGATLPLSASIHAIIRRINWSQASKASAIYADNKYWLSVPLDGATDNNAILVYDLLTAQWVSVDYYAAAPPAQASTVANTTANELSIFHPAHGLALSLGASGDDGRANRPAPAGQLLATDLYGQRTAFIVDSRRILALGHGDVDRVNSYSETPIWTEVLSRGYMLQEMRLKSLKNIAVVHETKNAEVSISVKTEAVNKEIPLQSQRTQNRTRYKVTGKRPYKLFDGTRYADPDREDYTWKASDRLKLTPGRPIPLGLMQSWDKGVEAKRIGRSFAVRVRCTRGRIKISGIQAEGTSLGNPPHAR